ncbi:hypothetical protein MRB53_031221 [Persea americana]|uniref:Uncharacterized protein n=1 Tax=Persea americana TaxID=3435 RepID=A0ACC2KNI8_PERAE|nr:hypothetical protein MRB53_031221 [Persea americana]
MERFGFENRYIPRLPDIPLVPGRDLKICLTLSPEPGCDRLRGKIDLHALLNNLVKRPAFFFQHGTTLPPRGIEQILSTRTIRTQSRRQSVVRIVSRDLEILVGIYLSAIFYRLANVVIDMVFES